MTKDHPSPYLILFALWLLVFSAASQTMIISPILPTIGEELSIGDAQLGTLVSVYSLMVGVFALISGPISDKIGRRRILLAGTGIMAVSLGLHALIVDYYSFLAARILSGAAGGVLSGSAVSYVGDYFPYNRRGWATGWIMSGAAFGQIFGIPVGVLLAGSHGFRIPFYMFAVTMALTFFLIYVKVPQPDVKRTDGSLSFGRAARTYWAMLRRRDVAAASFAFFLMFLGVSLFVVYLPTWLVQERGATPAGIASLFLIGGIANVLAGPQAGKLSDRIGRKGLVMLSCLGLTFTMGSVTWIVRDFWMAYPFFFVTMVLVAARISPFSALLTALVTDERRGSLMSLTVALGQVGFAFGAAIAGLLYSELGYVSNSLIGAASVLGMGLVVWFFVPEPELDPAASEPRKARATA